MMSFVSYSRFATESFKYNWCANAQVFSTSFVVLEIPSIVPPHTLVRLPPFVHAGSGINLLLPVICGMSCFQIPVSQSGAMEHTMYPFMCSWFPDAENSGASAAIRFGPVVHDT